MEQAFRLTYRKHEKKFNGVTFYQYEIVKLTGTGMQSRMHDCEKMFLYLASSNGLEFFSILCDEAYHQIYEIEAGETISATQMSRLNLLLALKKGVEEGAKGLR